MDLTVGSYNFVVEENPKLPVKDMRFAAPDIGWINILQRQRKIERAAKPNLSVGNPLFEYIEGFFRDGDFLFRQVGVVPKPTVGPDLVYQCWPSGITCAQYGAKRFRKCDRAWKPPHNDRRTAP